MQLSDGMHAVDPRQSRNALKSASFTTVHIASLLFLNLMITSCAVSYISA